ncbi:MAG TPA: dihydrofolate reductase family protein [Sphingomicrobium sp.]|nr:dihydrofolate reductase family protein [Sphingomicrobium sp.]
MAERSARVTIHMAASLDGFIARQDGSVDWMETNDTYANGMVLDPEYIRTFLDGIDCYVMGSETYLTGLGFMAKGLGWAYGDKPVYVLTSRDLDCPLPSVKFHCGDLSEFFETKLKRNYRNIWVAGGGKIAAACVRSGLADEIRYSILPVLIGRGISFFDGLDCDVRLHLLEATAYKSGIVALRHEICRSAVA